MALVLKTSEVKASVGSNPITSVISFVIITYNFINILKNMFYTRACEIVKSRTDPMEKFWNNKNTIS
jgi:hypothetical protein